MHHTNRKLHVIVNTGMLLLGNAMTLQNKDMDW